MTGSRYRALRFRHPDLDVPGPEGSGLQRSPQGTLSTVTGREAIRQSLLLLLSTMPGERVNRPEYGSYLHRLLFAPNDDTTAGLAIHYVGQAVSRWEPRVEVVGIDATRSPDAPEVLDLLLEYRIRATAEPDVLAVSMTLAEPGDLA